MFSVPIFMHGKLLFVLIISLASHQTVTLSNLGSFKLKQCFQGQQY